MSGEQIVDQRPYLVEVEFGRGVRIHHRRVVDVFAILRHQRPHRQFLPVKEVAIMCGFEDADYFSKVFRRCYGITPSQFRTTGMYASMGSRR